MEKAEVDSQIFGCLFDLILGVGELGIETGCLMSIGGGFLTNWHNAFYTLDQDHLSHFQKHSNYKSSAAAIIHALANYFKTTKHQNTGSYWLECQRQLCTVENLIWILHVEFQKMVII